MAEAADDWTVNQGQAASRKGPRLPLGLGWQLAAAILHAPDDPTVLLRGLRTLFRLAEHEVTRDWCRRCSKIAGFPQIPLLKIARLTKRLETGEKWAAHYRRPVQKSYRLATPVGEVFFAVDDPLNQQFFSRLMPDGELHEPGIVRYLCEVLSDRDIFVDIGAHTGYLSCIAGVAGATVITMEIQQPLSHVIERNLAMNGLRRCQVLEMGASDRDGFTMVPAFNAQFGAKLYDEQVDQQFNIFPVNSPNARMVPTMRLDTLFAEAAHVPTLVKIDAEGLELKILQGAKRLINGGKTTFLIEYHVGLVDKFGGGPDDLEALFPQTHWHIARLYDHGIGELDRDALRSATTIKTEEDVHLIVSRRPPT